MKTSVLVVEDEDTLANNIRQYLLQLDCEVHLAHTIEQGITALTEHKPQFALIDYKLPDGVTAKVETGRGAAKITLTGIDKEQLGQAAAVVRGFRPPDSYKGKGVRYAGEYIRLKAGKTAQ